MKKAIILDMDGTMFDTEPLWEKAFLKTGKDLGYNFTEELHSKTIGSNQSDLNKILKQEVGEDFPLEEFAKKYVENMKKVLDEFVHTTDYVIVFLKWKLIISVEIKNLR